MYKAKKQRKNSVKSEELTIGRYQRVATPIMLEGDIFFERSTDINDWNSCDEELHEEDNKFFVVSTLHHDSMHLNSQGFLRYLF